MGSTWRLASASPGVAGAYVATDLNLAPLPPSGTVEGDADGELEGLFSREPLARDVVRFVGEIVAVVVAETAGQAVDAAEMVAVEYEELPVVVDVEAAVAEGAPLLWPEFGTNVAHAFGVRVRRRSARGRGGGGARTIREPAGRARADGDERDRGGPR